MTRPPERRIGEPLGLTPEQLDQAAEVTAVDVALASTVWRLNAPAVLRDLLDAATEQRGG